MFVLMKRIGVLSDTHGDMPEQLYDFFKSCDEIWHAGDIGNITLLEQLSSFKPIKAVYGNIDGQEIKISTELVLRFTCEGAKVLITHIAGYPGKYNQQVKGLIKEYRPDIVICGHSHILKVIYDKDWKHIHINPGAAGFKGFHAFCTAIRFVIDNGKPAQMEVWEKKRKDI
jgi:hypothetical protein